MKVITILFAFILITSPICHADEAEWAQKYQAAFNTTDAFSALGAFQSFDKEVPDTQKISVLLRILSYTPPNSKSAQSQIIALDYCRDYGEKLPWTDVQEKDLLRLKDSPVSGIRKDVISFLDVHAKGKYRSQITYFLKDSDDEVRACAIDSIVKLPNSKAILLKYVEDNKDRPERRSYKYALHSVQ